MRQFLATESLLKMMKNVFYFLLTLFRMGFLGDCPTLPKIFHTYPTMMKLSAVIPYLRKILKMYKSRDTSLEFC